MVFRCRDLGKDRSTRPAWKMFMQWMPHSPSVLVSRMEKPASKDTSLNVGDPRPPWLKESPHAGSAPNGCAFGRMESGSPTTQWFIFGKLSLALQAGKRSKPVELHATTVTGSTPELATSPSLEGANTYVRTCTRTRPTPSTHPTPPPPHRHSLRILLQPPLLQVCRRARATPETRQSRSPQRGRAQASSAGTPMRSTPTGRCSGAFG